MEKEFITIKEYLELTGMSTQNLYRWIREGKIPKDELSTRKVEIQTINKNLIINNTWKKNRTSYLRMGATPK